MKELTRNEMAVVKRIAKSTKQLRDRREKIIDKMKQMESELDSINSQIDLFEQPIKNMTGGFTSEEVLNGTMEMFNTELSAQGEIGDTSLEEVEVPAEDAVTIDPNVQSPLEENVFSIPVNEVPYM